jgi:hypothetical protein
VWAAVVAAVPVLGLTIAAWHTFFASNGQPLGPRAQISEASVTPEVAIRDYLNSEPGQLDAFISRAKTRGVARREIQDVLRADGVVAVFTIELRGTVGTRFNVTRNVFTAIGDKRVSPARTTVVPPPSYVLHNPDERFVESTWIAYPRRAGRYLVELAVLDSQSDVLAHEQTGDFVVKAKRGTSCGLSRRRCVHRG